MKKIFLSAMFVSGILLFACNDGTKTADNTMDSAADAASDATSSAGDNVMKKVINLTPQQEVPANNSTASGSADITYNKDNHMLSYTVNWTGLTGEPTMAHIHGTAAKGVNAGVKRDLSSFLQKSTAGSFSDSVMVDGNEIKEDSLLTGYYYINIHTAAHPGGEIRGQIEF